MLVKGGLTMWLKDSKGNWFLAGEMLINSYIEPSGIWIKTPDDEWILHDEHGTLVGTLSSSFKRLAS